MSLKHSDSAKILKSSKIETLSGTFVSSSELYPKYKWYVIKYYGVHGIIYLYTDVPMCCWQSISAVSIKFSAMYDFTDEHSYIEFGKLKNLRETEQQPKLNATQRDELLEIIASRMAVRKRTLSSHTGEFEIFLVEKP